jgi:hypothetical protein
MHRIGIIVLGATLMVGVKAYAQSSSLDDENESQTTAPYYFSPLPPQGEPQRRPLFTFDGVNADVWAPVEAPYNPNMNRSAASDPIWEDAP